MGEEDSDCRPPKWAGTGNRRDDNGHPDRDRDESSKRVIESLMPTNATFVDMCGNHKRLVDACYIT